MKTFSRPVLFLLTLLLTAFAGRALEIRLAPGRSAHGFAFASPDNSNEILGSASGGFVNGAAGEEGWLQINFGWDSNQPFLLLDVTASEWLSFDPQGVELLDARTSTFGNNSGSTYWQYFLVPVEREDHPFVLAQGPVFYIASRSSSEWVSVDGSAVYTELRAPLYSGAMDFSLIDLATHALSPAGRTLLSPEVWEPYTGPMPLAWVQFCLDPGQAGQSFTLHSRADGGSECQQQVFPSILANTNPSMDAYWTPYTAPDGAWMLGASVGYGMEFWLTRAADGASSPHFWHTGQGFNGQALPIWNLLSGVFPPLSPPPIRINLRLPLSTFTVDPGMLPHGYYYFHENGGTSAGDLNIVLDSSGKLYSYDDYGVQNGIIEYAQAHFDVPGDAYFFAIYGLASGDPAAYSGASFDLLDWHPTHEQPPTISPNQLNLTLFAGRKDHTFSIRQPGSNALENSVATFSPAGEWVSASANTVSTHYGWGSVAWLNDYGTTVWLSVGGYSVSGIYGAAAGEWLHLYDVCQYTVPYDANKPFWIVDETTGETAPTGQAALGQWFPAPVPRLLAISSSRWGHDLWLAHPHGDAWPVTQHATQGDFSLTGTGAAWWNAYYWFDATAPARETFAWRLEDRDTGETTPFYPADQTPSFIEWIALANPQNLTAIENTDGTFALTWSFAETSTEGAFKIERRESASAPWQFWDTMPAAISRDALFPSTHTLSPLPASQPGMTASVRIYYEYGGQRSALSNSVALANLDSDGDDLPDWWELANNLNPNDPTDAAAPANPANPSGPTNGDNYNKGPDPTKTDSDKDGVKDAYDLYPDDSRRSRDVPLIHYAAVDLAPAVFGPNHYGWFAAIDDSNNVSILAAEYDAEGVQRKNYKVATWKLGDPLPTGEAIRTLPAPEKRGSYAAMYYPAGINATGKVVGTVYLYQYKDFTGPTPARPAGYPGTGSYAFTWSAPDPGSAPSPAGGPSTDIPNEPYLTYEGVTNSGLVWGKNSSGNQVIGIHRFKNFVLEPSDDAFLFHYEPKELTAGGPSELSPPKCLFTADGRAFGTGHFRSNPGDHSSSYDLASRVIWTGSDMAFIFGDKDEKTVVLAMGEGDRSFGYSERYAPTSAPVFSGPKAVPGTHPFVRVGETVSAFQSAISGNYQQQVAFGIVVPPATSPPLLWAVINPQGDIMAKAQLLTGKNRATAQWVDGVVLRYATEPDKFCQTDLENPPEMMNKDHIAVMGGLLLLPLEIKSHTGPFTNGRVDSLLSAWNGEFLNLYIDSPVDLQNLVSQENPITWVTPGSLSKTPPANTVEASVRWAKDGIKFAEISVFGKKKRIYIDVPWVGDLSEDDLVLMDPLSAGIVRYTWARAAETWAKSKERSPGDTIANALQHSYWSALIASDSYLGSAKAILYTTAHEFTNCYLDHQPAVDSTMDMRNNFVGSTSIHITTDPDNPLPDRAAIQQDLMNKLTVGQLWIIDADDNSQAVKSNGEKIVKTQWR